MNDRPDQRTKSGAKPGLLAVYQDYCLFFLAVFFGLIWLGGILKVVFKISFRGMFNHERDIAVIWFVLAATPVLIGLMAARFVALRRFHARAVPVRATVLKSNRNRLELEWAIGEQFIRRTVSPPVVDVDRHGTPLYRAGMFITILVDPERPHRFVWPEPSWE